MTENGKYKIVFNPKDAMIDLPMEVPCGQCIGCRLDRSRKWAARLTHQKKMSEDSSYFLTLTYSPEMCPKDMSLHVEHFQLFMKRYRKKFGEHIKYYHCGEYGDENKRPHYHAIIFGHRPDDLKPRGMNFKTKDAYYTSDTIANMWYGWNSEKKKPLLDFISLVKPLSKALPMLQGTLLKRLMVNRHLLITVNENLNMPQVHKELQMNIFTSI